MNILVIEPNWLGDIVMSSSLLQLIKEKYSPCTITVLVQEYGAALMYRMPYVTSVIQTKFSHKELALEERLKLAARLLYKDFDKVFVLPNSFKSALVPYFTKIKERIGWFGEYRYFVLTERHKNKAMYPSLVQQYCALAFPLKDPMPVDFKYPTPYMANDFLKTTAVKKKFALDKYIVLCPGAAFGKIKCWPAKNYAELATELKKNYQIVLLGAKSDSSAAEEIEEYLAQHIDCLPSNNSGEAPKATAVNQENQINQENDTLNAQQDENQSYKVQQSTVQAENLAKSGIINLVGKTDLDEAISIIAGATAVVANDSGLMHVAAALEKNVVALYGPTDSRFAKPENKNSKVIQFFEYLPKKKLKKVVPDQDGYHIGLQKITVNHVIVALNSLGVIC